MPVDGENLDDLHLKRQKICDRADVPFYISLEANEFFDEFDFIDNSLHFKINEPVAECTDNVQEFLDIFGFLDDLEPFNLKKYIPSIVYDDDTVALLDEPTETTAPLSFPFRLGLFRRRVLRYRRYPI